MHDVTGELVQLLELDVSKQRLDSTHVESNMAKFGRMRLMATAIRRFLVQLKRHDEGSYNALRKAVRERCEASDSAVFGWKTLDDEGVNQLRQSIVEDLAYLVERYRRNKDHNSRSTYLMLVKVFEQQCDVVDEKVVVKKHTGGDIVCNPSDPDATFDGHKGSGYQVQLSETCSPDNDVQLIVSAIPETSGSVFKHPAESRRLESPASRERALTHRQTDERWPRRAVCAEFCGVISPSGKFQHAPGCLRSPPTPLQQKKSTSVTKTEFNRTDFCRTCLGWMAL